MLTNIKFYSTRDDTHWIAKNSLTDLTRWILLTLREGVIENNFNLLFLRVWWVIQLLSPLTLVLIFSLSAHLDEQPIYLRIYNSYVFLWSQSKARHRCELGYVFVLNESPWSCVQANYRNKQNVIEFGVLVNADETASYSSSLILRLQCISFEEIA